MKKYKDLIANSMIFALGDVTSKIILFILLPLYTSYLTAHEYGSVDILQTSINLVFPILTLSIISSVFRFSIEKDSNNKMLMSNALVLIISGFILLVLLSPLLAYFFEKQYVLYFLIMYLASTLNTLLAQFSRGIGYVFHFALSGIFSSLTLIIANIITLILLNLGAEGFLIAYIASHLASIVYLLLKCNLVSYLNLRNFNKKLLMEMIKYSIYIVPNSISWWLTQAFGRYMIVLHSGFAAAGIYAAASKLPALINMLSSVFQQSWVYSSSQEINSENKEEFYSNVFLGYSTLIFVSSAFLLPNIPFIASLLLSSEFYEGWTYIPFLILAAVLGSFAYFYGTFYAAFKKNKMSMVSTMIGAIINVIFCLLLLPKFGVYGVVMASVLSYTTIFVVRIIDMRRIVDIKVSWSIFLCSLFILFLQCIILTQMWAHYFISTYVLAVFMIIAHFSFLKKIIKNLSALILNKYKISKNIS